MLLSNFFAKWTLPASAREAKLLIDKWGQTPGQMDIPVGDDPTNDIVNAISQKIKWSPKRIRKAFESACNLQLMYNFYLPSVAFASDTALAMVGVSVSHIDDNGQRNKDIRDMSWSEFHHYISRDQPRWFNWAKWGTIGTWSAIIVAIIIAIFGWFIIKTPS